MTIEFILLIIVSYLLASVPVVYLAAKWFRGVDLRQCGTGQVGGGNLWRMTRSLQITIPATIFDLGKGALMVWVGQLFGLSIGQQLAVGLAAIIGHNWSVFLRFSGGRGVGTTLGVVTIITLINNNLALWGLIVFLAIIVVGIIIIRSSAVPVLVGITALPLISWGFGQPLSVTMGFLVLFLVIVTKRLTASQPIAVSIDKKQLLLNRLLFDRDIRDRGTWVYRRPQQQEKQEKIAEEEVQDSSCRGSGGVPQP
jgi:glycerol-3-phosphate acyltransferase PlsY